MQSLYDDVIEALEDATFSISGVSVRKPFDESNKTYPLIVVHEIANVALNYTTDSGEDRTVLGYQLDIQTQNCVDTNNVVLGRYDAAKRLEGEVTDLLESTFKMVRRNSREDNTAADVMTLYWRGDCVLDSAGYTYRPAR